MNTNTPPKCPVSGCTARKFGNAAIQNENPQYGGQSLFVIQCENGHIIGPSVGVELRSLLEHQNGLLAHILKKLDDGN